jgi:UDP-N-acetylmuramate dehydrogenase
LKVEIRSPERLTTIGIGGRRKVYVPENLKELRSLIREGFPIIGGGSNVVLKDEGIPLISLELFKNVRFFGRTVELGAGVKLSEVLKLQQKLKFSLFEFLSGIPKATVGGLVAQNAGAFGKEVKDSLVRIFFIDRKTGELSVMEREEIERRFGYRKSPFSEKGVIISALFKIEEYPEIGNEIKRYVSFRLKNHPPFFLKTAGSTFKNPEKIPAGKLLEECGLKDFL